MCINALPTTESFCAGVYPRPTTLLCLLHISLVSTLFYCHDLIGSLNLRLCYHAFPHEPSDTFAELEHKPRTNTEYWHHAYTFVTLWKSMFIKYFTQPNRLNMVLNLLIHKLCSKNVLVCGYAFDKFSGKCHLSGTFSSSRTEWPPFYIALSDIFKYTMYWLLFHWSLFLDVQLTIRQYCFR